MIHLFYLFKPENMTCQNTHTYKKEVVDLRQLTPPTLLIAKRTTITKPRGDKKNPPWILGKQYSTILPLSEQAAKSNITRAFNSFLRSWNKTSRRKIQLKSVDLSVSPLVRSQHGEYKCLVLGLSVRGVFSRTLPLSWQVWTWPPPPLHLNPC